MSAATELGRGLRWMGSLLNVRAVRADDELRTTHQANPVDGRAEQIRREVLALEKKILP